MNGSPGWRCYWTRRSQTVAARRLRRLHRWLGLFAAAFALLLAVTGLLLNHSDALQLDRQRIRAAWIVNLYGLTPPALQASQRAGEHWVSLWGEQVFIDAAPLRGQRVTTLVAGFADAPDEGSLFIVTDQRALLVTSAGELIDVLALPEGVQAIAAKRIDDRIWIGAADGRNWSTDLDGSGWRSERTLAPQRPPEPTAAAMLPAPLADAIRQWWLGEGISVLQVVRDLHSGAIVRTVGRLLLDLAAVALIVLAFTGVWMALRPPRPSRPSRSPRQRPPRRPSQPSDRR